MTILSPLKARIKATDTLINEIVYRLYGLTGEEIKIIADSKDRETACFSTTFIGGFMLSNEVIERENFTISQVSEFLSALSRDNERWENPYPQKLKTQKTGWISRCHADSRWELIPLALRTGTILEFMTPVKHAPLSNNQEQIGAEYRLIENFRQFLDERGLAIPEDSQEFHSNKIKTIKKLILPILKGKKTWPPEKYLSLMALAQHHRIPTRLLDWTRDPYVAAYRAAKEAAEWIVGVKKPPKEGVETLSVWALNTFFLDVYQNKIKRQVITVTAPAYGNPNLHAQKGLFTLERLQSFSPDGAVYQRPLDEFVTDVFMKHKIGNGLLPIMRELTIPISASHEILRRLSARFVNAATLYPGFDGAAEALKEQRLWDKT